MNPPPAFVREGEGVWLCVQATEFDLPSGRIQVAIGTRFTRGARYYRLYRPG